MPESNKPRAPDDSHRLAIIGQNGTGKTVAGVYNLAHRSYHKMPWIVANYKGDDYLDAIPGIREMSPRETIPKEPGIYMVRPAPHDGSLDPLLMRAYMQGGRVGFYIDEGFMVGQHSQAFRTVLTQGRSLRIPMIVLSQRPVWMSKFLFTEANFFQVYPLLALEDRKKVSEWLPLDVNYPSTLEDYQSYYFDAGKRRLAKFEPVPYGDEVLDIFDRRRPRRMKRL